MGGMMLGVAGLSSARITLPLRAMADPLEAAGRRMSISCQAASRSDPAVPAAGIKISSAFDSGNIRMVQPPSEAGEVVLEIATDPFCEADGREHYQWYHFRASGVRSKPCTFRLRNAGGASYDAGWEGYNTTASYDRKTWFRVPSTYDAAAGEFAFQHTPEQDVCYYAYFAPYSLEQHADLVSWAVTEGGCALTELGQTVDGYPLDLLTAGTGPKSIWIIARQHPGESMAEWYMEGMLKRLLDPNDPVARSLLKECTFYMVPNMNPDGSRRGYLRTNAAGRNLNREWETPCADNSPEVYHVLKAMEATGVDMFLDVHGDEALPYNFIAGNEGIPSWDARLEALEEKFKAEYVRFSPDFQVQYGYPKDEPGTANLKIGSSAVGEKFKCLSMTLEQPFKDTADDPQMDVGWSPERAKAFGAAVLGPIAEVAADLR